MLSWWWGKNQVYAVFIAKKVLDERKGIYYSFFSQKGRRLVQQSSCWPNIVELFIMNDISYWQLGSKFARAWQIGDELDAS